MREIKFRAWDRKANRMYYPTGGCDLLVRIDGQLYVLVDIQAGNAVMPITRNLKLLQFTGLKDKDGKEIYEGDIVTIIQDGEELNTGVVECDAPNGGYNIRDFDGEYIEIFHNELVIIGNIYENPELLEAKCS